MAARSRKSSPLAESRQCPAGESALGHGVGLRREFFAALSQGPIGDVDFFEIISENFFTAAARPWAVLERVRREVPVVLHGVGMGLGDEDPLDERYLRDLERLIARVEPSWVSDHLCWTSQQSHHTHDLLPLPRTDLVLRRVVDKIARVQDRLKQQILIENVSTYVEFSHNEMSEVEFLREVASRADCLLLLDVNNVLVNSNNHHYNPFDFLASVPAKRVRQIHVAGHSIDDSEADAPLLIDTHVGPVPAAVWQLYREAIYRTGEVATLIEWDEAITSYDAVVQECQKAREASAEAFTDDRPTLIPLGARAS